MIGNTDSGVSLQQFPLENKKRDCERIGQAIENLYPKRLEEYYELLAYPYERSDNKDKALQYLDLANRRAEKVHAMQEAKAYFDKAMELLDALPENELALAYSGYGRCLKMQGNFEKARGYLTRALDILERLGTLIEPEKIKKECFYDERIKG